MKLPARLRPNAIRQPCDLEFVIFDDDYTVRSVVKNPLGVLFTTRGLVLWAKKIERLPSGLESEHNGYRRHREPI